jgi:SAM-dependent methyltransferase
MMQSRKNVDGGMPYDWGRTSADYVGHRPGYPESFFIILDATGIGHPGQRILDVGTGPGVLAIPLAQRGAVVTGLDIAENQVSAARALTEELGLPVDYVVADAHDTRLPGGSFEVVTASMCVHYFDSERFAAEVRRLLIPAGCLLIASLLYLPRESSIAARSEQLILQYNPKWAGADFPGYLTVAESWDGGALRLQTYHSYVEALSFTRESWRGRMRACRGVGASLDPARLREFDEEHAAVLAQIAPERFDIPHLVALSIYTPA